MWIFKTYPSWAPIFARLTLGIIFFAHGSQKLLGWFGGSGWSGTIQFFEQSGVPAFLAVLLIITEFFGGIAIILGLFTRLAALGLTIAMIVAIYKVHLQNGFFLNWFNVPNMGHGIEYNLALIGLSLSLLVWGGGNLSVDQAIGGEKKYK
ncbi:MAG TPA: DoxX family protein [Thermodesulfobacteriota bacterium]|jgi:putative oxidoreductase|nr:DoxX family protein [Thermodesulfobacteriota bacterium]